MRSNLCVVISRNMAIKLVRFVPYTGATEVWHVFVAQRFEDAPPGSRYFKEWFVDTKCQPHSTAPSDPKAKGKVLFADYDKKLHFKHLCKDCKKTLLAKRVIPLRILRMEDR